MRSFTAERMQINNVCGDDELLRAKALAENVLEPIREHFGIPFSPNSWYRCEELEMFICRKAFTRWRSSHAPNSSPSVAWKRYFDLKSHPKGEAADIEIPGVSNDELFKWIHDNLEFDQVIREFAKKGDSNSGWVHVSYRQGNNRHEAFDIE